MLDQVCNLVVIIRTFTLLSYITIPQEDLTIRGSEKISLMIHRVKIRKYSILFRFKSIIEPAMKQVNKSITRVGNRENGPKSQTG